MRQGYFESNGSTEIVGRKINGPPGSMGSFQVHPEILGLGEFGEFLASPCQGWSLREVTIEFIQM